MPQLNSIADQIEARRIELGKTSGFERLYAKVTKLYFGGMAWHLDTLRPLLKPGASLAYVVGDQASYLRVFIPTGQIISDIATSLGYELVGVDLFRTRFSTATKEQLREEVVVLRWPERKIWGISPNSPSAKILNTQQEERGITMDETSAQRASVYAQIIETVFLRHYQPEATQVPFNRSELAAIAQELAIDIPLNLWDVMYSFRYRQDLPAAIRQTAPAGKEWIITSKGRSQYEFVLRTSIDLKPNRGLVVAKILDATPSIVEKSSRGNDEQSLLTKVRYNRLIDVFTRTTCYSFQNHLRTTMPNGSQIETDEIYIGVDKRGAHYVFPVQAKGGTDKLGVVQIEQDFALCDARFPGLVCRPIAAQFMDGGKIALFSFVMQDGEARKLDERH